MEADTNSGSLLEASPASAVASHDEESLALLNPVQRQLMEYRLRNRQLSERQLSASQPEQ